MQLQYCKMRQITCRWSKAKNLISFASKSIFLFKCNIFHLLLVYRVMHSEAVHSIKVKILLLLRLFRFVKESDFERIIFLWFIFVV